jgi:hypothetical protein
MVYDLFNAPTPVDRPGVLMRYIPASQSSAQLTPSLSNAADWGYHAMTEGGRLLLLRRKTSNDDIMIIEYDPATHEPVDTTVTTIENSNSSPIHYGAFTVFKDKFYFQTYPSSTASTPWPGNIVFYSQRLGASSRGAMKTSEYNHILNDGSSTESIFVGFFSPENYGLCSSGQFLNYFQELDIIEGTIGDFTVENIGGACESGLSTSDLDDLSHCYGIDEYGMYFSRTYGAGVALYRQDIPPGNVETLLSATVVDSDNIGALIDVSKGYVLLHILDYTDFSNNKVLLFDTKNTNDSSDDEIQVLDLPGNGIPMNIQILVID